jgi:hypothetical protein
MKFWKEYTLVSSISDEHLNHRHLTAEIFLLAQKPGHATACALEGTDQRAFSS